MITGNKSKPSEKKLNDILNYYNEQRYDDAEKLIKSILQNFPDHLFSLKILAVIYSQTGKAKDAVKINQKIVTLSPNDPEVHNNLGISLKNIDKLDEARSSFEDAIKLNPKYANAYYNLSTIFDKKDMHTEALNANQKAIQLGLQTVEAYIKLGLKLYQCDRFKEAEESYRQAISLESNHPELYFNLGNTLFKQRNLKEAESSYKCGLALKPDDVEACNNLGNILTDQGKMVEAKINYEQAIKLKPEFGRAHLNLSRLKRFNIEDEQFKQMKGLCSDENYSLDGQYHLLFALSKAYEDLEDLEKAYEYYNKANAIRKNDLNYSIQEDINLFNELKNNYPLVKKYSNYFNKIKVDQIPVFITGMPRSGTTLVEQIISSHEDVTAGGELDFISEFGSLLARGQCNLNQRDLLNFRNKYLNKINNISKKTLMITDKMPNNFRFIGLIATAIPEAKIIHVKRNSAATCWGVFKQCFTSESNSFSYSLDDTVEYYRLYTDLMNFWNKSLSSRIYELDYDLLVSDQERETKQLIKYLGLGWEEDCLSPEKNTGNVYTASNVQVRKKVYKDSSKQWEKFKPFLRGLLDNI